MIHVVNYPIPIIETRGSPYEVGSQIGVAARDSLCELHAETLSDYGADWSQLRTLAAPFVTRTANRLPRVVAELRGCADGAGIPFDDLFLMGIEELLYQEVRGMAASPGLAPAERAKGCSDLAAAPPATADGHVWLAHNNDLDASTLPHLFVTRFCVDGEPEILAVTVGGIFISIGLNVAGLALTGNQLNANDSRIGVPRLYVVRDLLSHAALENALAVALMPERASSYNNILAYAPPDGGEGRIVNVEGSATAAALTWSYDTGGAVAHTNHYLAPDMLAFEADHAHVSMSATRCARALDYTRKYHGAIDFDICARFLRDHVYAPWSVCKHAGQSVTVFGAIIDLTERRMWLTRGNPCQHDFVPFEFARADEKAAQIPPPNPSASFAMTELHSPVR